MTEALSLKSIQEMDQITAMVAKENDIPVELIRRHGKLTQTLMGIRRIAIRRIHATSLYRRTEIALYFGLSIYTITSSLEDSAKDRPVPFTAAEDQIILTMHCAGQTVDQIQQTLPARSLASLRRRITSLRKVEEQSKPFPRPSYRGSAPELMLEMARKESARMLSNL